MSKSYIVYLILFLSFISVSIATNFSSCQTFLLPDTYDLTSNIQINGSSCLTVSTGLLPASPTTIDCHGYEIVGNYSANKYGISVQNADNITIKNCIFRKFGSAMTFNNGSNAIIQNNTFDNSTASGILFGANNGLVSNITFTNNTVSNNWNNGIEIYNMSYGNFSDNILFGHEHGHGTDRTGQFVYNVVYTNWTNNYMYNNTICFRNDATNVSNVIIANNICENNTGTGFLTFSGSSSGAGRYGNITIANNSVSSLYNSSGFDFGWGASTTTENDCANWFVENNTATGGALVFLNSLNSSSVISNLNIGALVLCDVDNLQLYNVTLTGGADGRNGAELMQVNNLTWDGYTATNIYTALRGLIVNDSIFTNLNLTGGQISTIDFAGGTSSRNNLSFINISGVKNNAAISMGGVNNNVSDFYIHDSNTTGWVIGFQSATSAINNTYTRGIIENTPVAIGITNVGPGNIIQHIQARNVSTLLLVNSTASGTKTYLLRNVSVSNSGGNPPLFRLDQYDSVAPSEQYSIGLPREDFAPTSMPNNRTLFRYHVLNFTKIAGSSSIDSSNFTWLDSEMYNGYNEATLESYYYNSSSGAWQLLNNTPDTTNNKLGQNPLVDAGVYGLFDYVNCPVFTVPENYEVMQDYSGAPNFLGGQFSCIYVATSNMNIECADHNITGDGSGGLGIFLATGVSNTSISNCNINNYFYGIFNQNGQNNSVSQSTITNSIASGIYLDSSNNNVIQSNDFIGNAQAIDLVYADQYNNIYGNQIINSSTRGIDVSITSNLNNITLNSFSGNNIDMTFLSSTANNITNNALSGAGFVALQIVGATSNIFQSNAISGAFTCVDISSFATGNTLAGNVISGCGNAVKIDSTMNTDLSQNNISGSTFVGFTNTNSNTTLNGDIFYGNVFDLQISATSSGQINATNILLLPISGTMENYSNLSIFDTQSGSENYIINYGADIPVDNSTYQKFQNKRFTLINQSANASIDSLTYYYLDSELNASESDLQMFSYAGSNFVNQIATLDTSANTLTKTNLNNFAQIGLYYAPFSVIRCKLINSSGDYIQPTNLTGAGTLGINSLNACVVINASDVSYDCGSNQLNENLTPTTRSGFLVQGQDLSTYNNNITIRNCVIDGYYNGIETVNVNGLRVTNNTIRNIPFDGITTLQLGLETTNSSFDHNTIHNTTVQAIQTFNLTYSNISDNVMYNNYGDGTHNGRAIELGWGTQNNLIQNNTGYNGLTGIRITGQLSGSVFPTPNNVFINNSMYNNVYGFFSLVGTHNLTLTGNNFSNNSDADWYFTIGNESECDNTIANNTGTGGKPLLYYQGSNVVSNLDAASIMLCNADDSNLTNINVTGNMSNYIQSDFSDRLHLVNISALNINQGLRYKSGNNSVFDNFNINGTPGKDSNVKPASGPTPINDTYIGAIYLNGSHNKFNNLSIYGQSTSSNRIVSAFVSTGNNVTINNLTIANGNYSYNSIGGIEINNSRTTINGGLIYNYDRAIFIRGGSNTNINNLTTYNTTSVIYLNGSATGNYTISNSTISAASGLNPKIQLNIFDAIVNGEIYTINMSSSPASNPTGNSSVGNKYFNLTQIGTTNISEIDVLWLPSEVVNESNLIVQKYNGSWAVPLQTLNTTTHMIVLTFETGSGVYGLFDITGASISNNYLIPEASLAFGVVAYMYYRSQRGGYVRVFILFGWL